MEQNRWLDERFRFKDTCNNSDTVSTSGMYSPYGPFPLFEFLSPCMILHRERKKDNPGRQDRDSE